MREILFRGKRIDNGGWAEGFCAKTIQGNSVIFNTIDECACGFCMEMFDSIKNYVVIPESVGQYTGLTDKNGTPMYEGDIIKGAVHWLERYKLAWVGFKDGSFGLFWKRGDVIEFNPFTSLCNVIYEVAGNIYDNDIDKLEADYDFI